MGFSRITAKVGVEVRSGVPAMPPSLRCPGTPSCSPQTQHTRWHVFTIPGEPAAPRARGTSARGRQSMPRGQPRSWVPGAGGWKGAPPWLGQERAVSPARGGSVRTGPARPRLWERAGAGTSLGPSGHSTVTLEQVVLSVHVGVVRDDVEGGAPGHHLKHQHPQRPPVHAEPWREHRPVRPGSAWHTRCRTSPLPCCRTRPARPLPAVSGLVFPNCWQSVSLAPHGAPAGTCVRFTHRQGWAALRRPVHRFLSSLPFLVFICY